jgi:hypothetical protein
VTILRPLAEQEPDNFLSDLAITLGLLGQLLLQIRKPCEASASIAEAIRLLKRLAREQPEVSEFSDWLKALRSDQQVAKEWARDLLPRRAITKS